MVRFNKMTRVPHVLNCNCKLFITLDQDKTTPHRNSFILWWSGSLDTSTIFALLFQKILSLLLDCMQNRLLVCWILCSSTAPQSPRSSSSLRTQGRWCSPRPATSDQSQWGAAHTLPGWILSPPWTPCTGHKRSTRCASSTSQRPQILCFQVLLCLAKYSSQVRNT